LTESGQILEAQNLILEAIETQVGGTAEATANSSDKMNVAFSLFKEQLATGLLPVFDELTKSLIPLIQDLGPKLSGAITATVGVFKTFFGFISNNLPVIATFVGVIGTAVVALNAVRIATAAWAAVQTLLNFILAANPIGLVVVAVAALAAGIVYIATQTQFFQNAWKALTDFLTSSWRAVSNFFKVQFPFVADFFTALVTSIRNIWNGFLTFFGNAVKSIVGFFKPVFDAVGTVIRIAINTWIGFVQGFFDFFTGIINGILTAVQTVLNAISSISGGAGSISLPKVKSPKIPKAKKFAEGGFVTGPVNAIIGEAGPEVVTPLKDFERMMGLDKKGASRVINYYAAENKSVDSEQALLQAIKRAKVITGW
jgi:hypothetical protein